MKLRTFLLLLCTALGTKYDLMLYLGMCIFNIEFITLGKQSVLIWMSRDFTLQASLELMLTLTTIKTAILT